MDIRVLAERIALELNNKCEYQLTINEYHNIRNAEYFALVNENKVKDTDDNWNDFDTYLARNLNINWG